MQDIRLYKGDQRQITLETGFDWTNIGSGNSRTVKLVKPDATTATITGTNITVTDTVNGLVTISLNPDQAGEWMAQAKCTSTAAVVYFSPVTLIRVSDAI